VLLQQTGMADKKLIKKVKRQKEILDLLREASGCKRRFLLRELRQLQQDVERKLKRDP